MRLGVYFETKMAIFIKKIIIVYLHSYVLGARGHMLHEKILKTWCSFGVYFDQIVSWKLIYFYIKNNYYSYSIAMRYSYSSRIFLGKTCHNSYVLVAFWMKKWFFSNRNNDISCTHARGNATLRENFEKNVQFNASWWIFWSDFVLNFFFKGDIFL